MLNGKTRTWKWTRTSNGRYKKGPVDRETILAGWSDAVLWNSLNPLSFYFSEFSWFIIFHLRHSASSEPMAFGRDFLSALPPLQQSKDKQNNDLPIGSDIDNMNSSFPSASFCTLLSAERSTSQESMKRINRQSTHGSSQRHQNWSPHKFQRISNTQDHTRFKASEGMGVVKH